MKKLILILMLLPIIALGQTSDSVVNRFINKFKNGGIIQYHIKYFYSDELRGDYVANSFNCELIVPEDTTIGGYYNFKKDDEQVVYAGNEHFENYPEYYGKKVVKYYQRKKNPEEFINKEMNFEGMTGYVPNVAERQSLYGTSMLYFVKILSDRFAQFSWLADTVINDVACSKLKISNNFQIYFSKKDSMPVYFESYKTRAFYSDYSFTKEKPTKFFSKLAFPKGYKFVNDPKWIAKEKETLKIGTKAPVWELPNINDSLYKSKHYKAKPILMIFTEIGCPGCMLAMPDLNKIANEYKDLKVFAVYPLNTKKELTEFKSKRNMDYEVLYKAKTVKDDYKISAYPTFYLIDKKGLIHFQKVGYSSEVTKELRKEIEKILGK